MHIHNHSFFVRIEPSTAVTSLMTVFNKILEVKIQYNSNFSPFFFAIKS